MSETKEMTVDQLAELMQFDPLDYAERVTGESYKTNQMTARFGFGLHFDKTAALKEALSAAGDTHFSMSLDEYRAVVEREGFREVLALPFVGADDKTDRLFIFWHYDGLLLVFDTYWGGKSVNGGKVYYNWAQPKDAPYPSGVLSSHSSGEVGDERLYFGDHDCREGIRTNIARLRARGRFLATWHKQPFLYLLHYMDTKQPGYDYKAINAERIAMLPEHIRAAIGVPS